MKVILVVGLIVLIMVGVFVQECYEFLVEQVEIVCMLIDQVLELDLVWDIVELLIIEVGLCLGGLEVEVWVCQWGVDLGEEFGFDCVVIEEFFMLYWECGDMEIIMNVLYIQVFYGMVLGGFGWLLRLCLILSDIVYFCMVDDLMVIEDGLFEG